MDKKKICFIAQFPPPIHGLSKAVDTLYYSKLNSAIAKAGTYKFEKVNLTDNKKIFKVFYQIAKSDADLFYLTISQTKGGNLRDLVILKILKMRHKKCLIHLHGGYYRDLIDNDLGEWQRKANYRAIGALSGAIVLSFGLKRIFSGLLSDEKIYVVPNCVDEQYLMSDQEYQNKIKSLNDKTIYQVVYLSNFIRSKGYPEVLKMAMLEKKRVDSGKKRKLHFNFAGKFFEDAEQNCFENYIKTHNLEHYVSYYGVIDGKRKRDLLKKGNIFVLPTRYPKEGQPISILEGMGNAMMVVTTDHAGIPDIVQDHVNGILMKENDSIEAVYQQLISIDNKELGEIGKRNRELCKTYFTQQTYLDNMKKIFDSI